MICRDLFEKEHQHFFALSEISGSVFSSLLWTALSGDHTRLVGLFHDDGSMFGGMVFYATRMKGVKSLITPPFTPHCSLFWKDMNITNVSRQLGFEKEILSAVGEYLRNSKYGLIKIEFPTSVNDVQPLIWSGFDVRPRYTYRLNLDVPEEELRQNLDPKTRSMINKAERENYTVRTDTGLNEFSGHINDTLRRQAVPSPDDVASRIIKHFHGTDRAISLNVVQEKKSIGSFFSIVSGDTVYYLFGGIDRNAGSNAIATFGVWNTILEAKRRGKKVFDFEGSMVPEIEKFFRGFGAQLVPYYSVLGGNKLIRSVYKLLGRV